MMTWAVRGVCHVVSYHHIAHVSVTVLSCWVTSHCSSVCERSEGPALHCSHMSSHLAGLKGDVCPQALIVQAWAPWKHACVH
jgi:hypothetical protein